MIYEYIPHKDPRQSMGQIIIFISAAVGCFMFPAIFPHIALRWLFQLTGALFLVGVVFVYTRRIAKNFIYRIVRGEEDELLFSVTEVTGGGRSRVTVCRFSLDSIEEAYSIGFTDTEKKKALCIRAKKEHRKTFDYSSGVSADRVAYIYVREGGEPLFVKVVTDDILFSYLSKKD